MQFTDAELAVLQSGSVRWGLFFRLESDPITRLWLGYGDIEPVDDLFAEVEGYSGAGELLNYPTVKQLLNGATESATISLSGVTPEIVALATAASSEIQGKTCTLGTGLFDSSWQLVAPIRWLRTFTAQYLTCEQRAQPDPGQPMVRSVSLTLSDVFARRRRGAASYWTDQDQKARSPTDNFLDRRVNYNPNFTKKWPAT